MGPSLPSRACPRQPGRAEDLTASCCWHSLIFRELRELLPPACCLPASPCPSLTSVLEPPPPERHHVRGSASLLDGCSSHLPASSQISPDTSLSPAPNKESPQARGGSLGRLCICQILGPTPDPQAQNLWGGTPHPQPVVLTSFLHDHYASSCGRASTLGSPRVMEAPKSLPMNPCHPSLNSKITIVHS